MKISIGTLLVVLIVFSACNPNKNIIPIDSELKNITVPDEFEFTMDQSLSLNLSAQTQSGDAYPELVWFIYDKHPEEGGSLIQYLAGGSNGTYRGQIEIPEILDSVFIGTNYAGIAGEMFSREENSINYQYSGSYLPMLKTISSGQGPIFSNTFDSDMEGWKAYRDDGQYASLYSDHELTPIDGPSGPNDGFIWGFDTKGGLRSWEAPDSYNTDLYGYYIKYDYYIGNTVRVRPTQANLADVRITDGKNVLSVDLTPTFPHRVNGGWQSLYIKLDETAVNGTGWRYASGLGTWTTGTGTSVLGKTSATAQQIKDILQNVTGILMAPESQVGYYNTKGPEFVALDNVNIVESLQDENVQTQKSVSTDNDDDGIGNDLDDYPDDPDKAFNNYYPAESIYGTLAYEDLWPASGDYDFNDLVIGYRFNHIKNAANLITQLDLEIVLRAIGGSARSGFGIQLDIPASVVSEVISDYSFDFGNLSINEKGLEEGQEKATIICFLDAYHVLDFPGDGSGINTEPDATYVEPETIKISIKLNKAVTIQELGHAPNNPFIFRKDDRGREVHLPGYKPTDLVDDSYFGTEDDFTNPTYNYYYRTPKGLPWAMNVPIEFAYPIEKSPIDKAYKVFTQWAQSGGFSFMDWYQDVEGYRDNTELYGK